MRTVNEGNATRPRCLVREPWWAYTVDREVKANRMSGDKGKNNRRYREGRFPFYTRAYLPVSPGQGVPMKATYRTELSQYIKHIQPHRFSHQPCASVKHTHTHTHTVNLSLSLLLTHALSFTYANMQIYISLQQIHTYTHTHTHTHTHNLTPIHRTPSLPLSLTSCSHTDKP